MEGKEAVMLSIDAETVGYIIVKAREFDEKVAPEEREPGSNPTDDKMVEVLEDRSDDPTYEELMSALQSLNEDQLLDLIALSWIGRGDYESEDWKKARAEAAAVRDKHIPSYLVGTPLLGDYLEEGLAKLGYSSDDETLSHL
jgi:hypothetical protein